MGVNWISWSSAVTVIITLLHIQGVVSITTMTVTVEEGQTLSFRRNYTRDSQKSTSTYFLKYFYRVDSKVSNNLIVTKGPDQLWENGRFSLYDNSAEACVIVRVDKASAEDSGTYWCGVDVSAHPDDITVVQLTVVAADSPDILWRSSKCTVTSITHQIQQIMSDIESLCASVALSATVQMIPTAVIQVSNPLFLTAVMCVAAMLFVCVFTLGLMLTVKHRSSAPSHNRQTSADYETMMPSVQNQPEPCCPCPDCVDPSAFSSPPPNVCANSRSNEYAAVDVLEHSCQYQSLDDIQGEEKVYQDLYRNCGVKDERAV
ncbi:CMRF35-like molecule 8 isoform X4 [Betta splendens]|uniref:CMRF35-like molecule 8 isoform X4 n=1 Tax=Betta splendens TaxID=158456 RepID=A0A6P7LXT9_BETSP|nr:CMRF35-like molecule 8 isoform X4 [Betta splendens]